MKEKEIQEKIKDEFTKKMEALRENEKETLNKIKEIPDTNDYSSDILMGLASCRQVAAFCTAHCNTCVAPDVRPC